MATPGKDYHQQKVTGGEQKVILNEKETAETDERDPAFERDQPNTSDISKIKSEPGDHPRTELI